MVWTRLLALELGHTTAAASAVLAAFMGGLAVGAFAGSAWARRLSATHALRAYAVIEIAIAVLALLVPIEITAFHRVLALAYGDGPGGAFFHGVRFASALLIVGIPATLMGATYPLITQAAGSDARAAGALYASNTAGAALGALAAGFVLLPRFGLFRSTLIGIAGNGIVAAIAWRLGARMGEPRKSGGPSPSAKRTPKVRPTAETARPDVAARSTRSHLALAIFATAAAGCSALALELAWTRTLAMVMGPTTYAFSTTIACFIVGLALGSAAASWLLRARDHAAPIGWLALTLAAAALATGVGVSAIDDMLLAIARRGAQPDITYRVFLMAEFRDAALRVVPAAVAFGAAFPFSLAVARASSSRDAGWLYGANTIGAIAGSLVTAAFVLPAIGLLGTFAAASVLLCSASLVLALFAWRRAPVAVFLSAALVTAAGLALKHAGWNPKLLSSGAYKYAAYIGVEDLDVRLTAGTLQYYREGASGTVAVRDLAGVRTLAIDGKVDASNGGDMLTQRLLAHVPFLLHPSARRAAIVGLGSGVTLGSALTYPVSQVDVVEISPEVVSASRWFSNENHDALGDPRVRLLLGDARTHFRLASTQYDVIVSEPSNPWMAGVAALFTREFFDSLRARLAPGGVICQWAHTYDIESSDLRSIVGTFATVFPHVGLWLVGDGDLLLLGSERPLESLAPSAAVPGRARADLQASGVPSIHLLELLKIGNRDFALRWSKGAPLQTDDRMALEFSAPAATVGASGANLAGDLMQQSGEGSASDPAEQRQLGLMLLNAQAPRRAWDVLWAVAQRSDDEQALDGLVKAAGMLNDPERFTQVEQRLRVFLATHPDTISVRIALARLLASTSRYEEAFTVIQSARNARPADAEIQEEFAAIAADAGDASRLQTALTELRALGPAAAQTSYFEAVLRMLDGQPAEAARFAQSALASNPRHAASWNVLGAALGASDAPADEIRQAFRHAIEADPSDPAAYVNLGTLELNAGRSDIAADWFAQALTLSPDNQGARQGLAAARRASK